MKNPGRKKKKKEQKKYPEKNLTGVSELLGENKRTSI